MTKPRVTKFELQLLEKFWELGPASVREIQESLPEKDRPAYTTVQTIVYRLEEKGAVRRVKKVGKAYVFESTLTRREVYASLIRELLDAFGGSPTPVVSHLIESGRLTLADVREMERMLAHTGKKR
jgi:BlaI family transcriptional regulator, penicillinase repressor